MDHVRFWCGAVPVLLVRGEIDDATRLDLDGIFAFLARAAGARDYVEDLALRMGVPVCAGTRFEEDAVDGYVG
jgi:hypothetical protein